MAKYRIKVPEKEIDITLYLAKEVLDTITKYKSENKKKVNNTILVERSTFNYKTGQIDTISFDNNNLSTIMDKLKFEIEQEKKLCIK